MKKLEIGVIGLGKFGLQIATTLTELGHRVIGLDGNREKVRLADAIIAKAYQGDATSKPLLEQLRFQDLDQVIVSVGHSMEASILVALNLSDLHIKHIIAKATSLEHRKVLMRLGVHKVIQPEMDVAVQIAYQLHHPGMLDFLPVGGGVLLQEICINAWAGKTLAELNLTNQFNVIAVAQKKQGQKDFSFVPNPQLPLQQGDILILIGKPESMKPLVP